MRELKPIDPKTMHAPDYVLYLLATSELLTDEPKAARAHFAQLAQLPSRFSVLAR